MQFQKKKILITVKAYPNPSKKYGETVCCAGVDLSNSQLIRLYPIPFRELQNPKKFKKYSIIEVDCIKTTNDKRPESYKVNADSIKVMESLDSEKGKWTKRKELVLKAPVKSMCGVLKDQQEKDVSLGIVKPRDIEFESSKSKKDDEAARDAAYAQLRLFGEKLEKLEQIPFNFYYQFKCFDEVDCPSHRLLIIDWEIHQLYRNLKSDQISDEALIEKIKEKWLAIADTSKNDVYIFVGNMKRIRENFMVLGVFYPKKNKDPQPTLFD